ncbi:hypothetical protein [Hymenobacter metallicola]|uniref:Uncharacterized protein n=1 Tax=Hymenobacter metallicola TaxID=2563114 RepID=A0A4Z0Q969_9BACT|nr:hypothetical protein [Hymenobacter metallicola]TGE26638.1 hypothetical protein E5K02_17805 [Hymenobacter metallicola]
MRATLLLLVVGSLFCLNGANAGRAGEGPSILSSTASVTTPLRPGFQPDTSRKALQPDSVVATATPVLPAAEDDKPTRKTSIRIVAAIALLTVITLLLYNVRSR